MMALFAYPLLFVAADTTIADRAFQRAPLCAVVHRAVSFLSNLVVGLLLGSRYYGLCRGHWINS